MRVLYVYKEYGARRRKYGYEMAKLGHKVSFIKLKSKRKPNQIKENIIKEYEPDMVWLLSPFFVLHNVISRETIEILKQKSIPIVTYATFNTQIAYNEMDDIWKTFDFFFAQQKDFYKYLKDIDVNTYYMPLAFYPDQYKPLKMKQTIQISFAGNPQTTVDVKKDKRLSYLKALDRFDVKIYGEAFRKRGMVANDYHSHGQQCRLYAESKINLDLPFINSSLKFYDDQYHLKNRFVEVPATNNFLMTVKCDEFVDMLDETMVGYFDDGIESMIEMVSKYLKDKNERERMSKRAYVEVVNNHTFSHRFKKMFNIIGSI